MYQLVGENQGQPGPPKVSFLCNLRLSYKGDLPKSETNAWGSQLLGSNGPCNNKSRSKRKISVQLQSGSN